MAQQCSGVLGHLRKKVVAGIGDDKGDVIKFVQPHQAKRSAERCAADADK